MADDLPIDAESLREPLLRLCELSEKLRIEAVQNAHEAARVATAIKIIRERIAKSEVETPEWVPALMPFPSKL